MPKRPIHLSQKEDQNSTRTYLHSQSHSQALQHGEYREHKDYSILLELPVESLTHVTSYLAPPYLVALGRTCRRLHDHVKDDNTWYRAFLTQVVGIHPECSLSEGNAFLLRMIERTWREEFVSRYMVRQQWEHSRTPCIVHTPQDMTIDDVHLVSPYIQSSPLSHSPRSILHDQSAGRGPALLATSLQYGTVSRSFPLAGKILKGYLGPSGTDPGIGNPNAEFTPDVSACEIISSEYKGSVSVVWGKRNGEILLTTTSRAFEPGSGLATSNVVRCDVQDLHHGIVNKILVDSLSDTFLSAGGDGRVKLWDWAPQTLNCVWTSEQSRVSLVPDGVVGLAGGLSSGVIVGALASGDICLWWVSSTVDVHADPIVLSTLRIGDPTKIEEDQSGSLSDPGTTASRPKPKLDAIHILRGPDTSSSLRDSLSPSAPSSQSAAMLMTYTSHSFFYLLTVTSAGNVGITRFGDGECGCSMSAFEVVSPVTELIACSSPSATPQEGCRSGTRFVVVGDQMGFVSFYDIDNPTTLAMSTHNSISPSTSVTPAMILHVSTPKRKFLAHTDGSVTSIAWSPYMFVTGSQGGSVIVWDSITLEGVRQLDSLQFSHRPLHPPHALDLGGRGVNGDGNGDAERDGDGVSKILIEKQMVVAVRGNRVMTWISADIGRSGKWRRRARGKKVYRGKQMEKGVAKGLDRHDFQTSIRDSISEIAHERELEREWIMRNKVRVREEREGLENLGLDETEAVQYVMWLSREEYLKGAQERPGTGPREDVSEGDFNNFPDMASIPNMDSMLERAGGTTLVSSEFPPILRTSTSGSSTASNLSPSTPASVSKTDWVWGSASVLRPSTLSAGGEYHQLWSACGSGQGSPSSGAGSSVIATGWRDDDDLRFAIELSLAEANSRGDVL